MMTVLMWVGVGWLGWCVVVGVAIAIVEFKDRGSDVKEGETIRKRAEFFKRLHEAEMERREWYNGLS